MSDPARLALALQPLDNLPWGQEGRLMRRALLGSLVFFAVVAGSSTFAAEPGPSSGTDNAQATPSNGAQLRRPENSKQVEKAKPKKPAPASLSAAEAAAARTIELPAPSSRAGTSPADTSWTGSPPASTPWTGFHVGVEGGISVGGGFAR
jgi:hypothetical protein